MSTPSCSPRRPSPWTVPVLCVVLGLVFLAIGLAHHDASGGVSSLVVMLVSGAGLVAFRHRSEAVDLLAGGADDERRIQLVQRSSATTGQVLAAVITGGLLWTQATSSPDAGVFSALAVVTGVSVIGSTVWHARRG